MGTATRGEGAPYKSEDKEGAPVPRGGGRGRPYTIGAGV